MTEILTTSNVMFALGILGIIFSVYNYFRNPQIKSERIDALLDQRVKFANEMNDRRFVEVQKDIKVAFELAQNHSNEALAGVKELTSVVNSMGRELSKLSTIIEERIPKK